MKITYFARALDFPIVEGTMRQIWTLAKTMAKKGHEVEIRIHSDKKGTVKKEGIRIIKDCSNKLYRFESDILHFFGPAAKPFLNTLIFSKTKKKIITLTDGRIRGVWNNPLTGLFMSLLNVKIILFSRKQLSRKTYYQIIPIIKPEFKKTAKKTKDPSILFMHGIAEHKGFFDLMSAFDTVKKKIPKLQLVVATSTPMNEIDKKYRKKGVVYKSIVDAEKELSKSWIYVYAIQKARSTLAIPISLIEAIQTGTPFICSRVGSIPDYFDDFFLVPPKNPQKLAEKIVYFIKNYKKIDVSKALKKKWTNEQVIRAYERLYR